MLLNRINEGFIRKYQVDEAIKNNKKNRKKIVEAVERPEKFDDYDDDMNFANYGAEEGFFEIDEVDESLNESADRNASVIQKLSKDLEQCLTKKADKSQRNTTLQIYIDQSGSWGNDDVQMAFDILNSIKQFEIKIDVYYFANHIYTDAEPARAEGGTGAGTELIQQLNSTRPDNVIIMTDDDFDYWADHHDGNLGGSYTAPGGVWLVFRGSRSKALIRAVHGKLMTKYYDIG